MEGVFCFSGFVLAFCLFVLLVLFIVGAVVQVGGLPMILTFESRRI